MTIYWLIKLFILEWTKHEGVEREFYWLEYRFRELLEQETNETEWPDWIKACSEVTGVSVCVCVCVGGPGRLWTNFFSPFEDKSRKQMLT